MTVLSQKKLISKILAEKPQNIRGDLFNSVEKILKKRKKILSLTQKYQTPFYIFDQKECETSAKEFARTFGRAIPNFKAYYALKSNPYSGIIKTILNCGLGIDVSSGRELEIGLQCGAREILFSGPGKTTEELNLAVKNNQITIINLDSFGELKRLGELLKAKKTAINTGVRVFTKYHGEWNKFGIPLEEMATFFRATKKYPQVRLAGIQCHMSFNEDAIPYQKTIAEIGCYLKKRLGASQLRGIKFFDFGGGFLPFRTEAYFPWAETQGEIIKSVCEHFGREARFKDKYYRQKSLPINDYAAGIALALKKYIEPILPDCKYFAEPGRIIAKNAMHIVLRVMDVKREKMAIMDGGTNIVGWEIFEWNYVPLVNLTRPDKREIKFKFYGSLCLPEDIWGRWCYAKKIAVGDVIVIPFVGAYTYTFAQNFIKPIPKTYILK